MPDTTALPSLVGLRPPRFTAPLTGSATFDSDATGQLVVLVFYPKDDTPGCSDEASQFATLHDQFTAAGARIVGVSRDSLKSHERFREKMQLPFALLSDPDAAVCNLFGVIRDKTMYGRVVRGIERSTFVLDATGTVRAEWRRVKVPGHATRVLETVLALARGVG